MLSQANTVDDRSTEELVKTPAEPECMEPPQAKPKGVLRIALLGVSAAGVVAMMLLASPSPVYVAQTSILLDNNPHAAAGAIDAQIEQLHAETLLRKVIAAQHLATDPEFASPAPDLLSRIFDRLSSRDRSVAPNDAEALANLASKVSITHRHGSFIADVAVTAAEPDKAKRLVEALAATYLEATKRAEPIPAIAGDGTETVAAEDLGDPVGSIAQADAANSAASAVLALSEAKNRTADAKARQEQIQRLLASNHPLDLISDSLQSPTLDSLRLRLADVERQEVSYKTTLGERHPAMLQTEQLLHDLRRQIAEELKRLGSAAARDYADALAEQTRAERASATAEAEQQTRLAKARSLALKAPGIAPGGMQAAMPIDMTPTGKILAPATVESSDGSGFLSLCAVLGACLAFGLWWRLKPRRRLRPNPASASSESVETVVRAPDIASNPVLATAKAGIAPAAASQAEVDKPAGRALEIQRRDTRAAEIMLPKTSTAARRTSEPEGLAVLGRIPLAQGVARPAPWETRVGGTSGRNAAAALAELVRQSFSPFGLAIIDLHKILRAAAAESGLQPPWTLLVTTPGDPGAYAAVAAGLARAAVREGQRTLIFEGDVDRQYRRHLIDPHAQPAFIDFDRTPRPVYALGMQHHGLFLAPACPNETSIGQIDQGRQVTIDAFDFVVIAGSSVEEDAASIIAEAADMVLIVGQPETSRKDLAAAAAKFGRSKLCAAVTADAPPFIGARGVA